MYFSCRYMFFRQKFIPYRYKKAARVRDAIIAIANFPIKINLLLGLGYFCISLSLMGILFLASPLIVTESIIQLQKLQRNINTFAFNPRLTAQSKPSSSAVPKPTPAPDPATLPFSISIPKINIDAKVVSNVDAAKPQEYTSALKKGVAHALGSAFPGQGKMVYIFGHSTDYAWNVETYNALFYQVKELVPNDEITLKLGDKEYKYLVREKKILAPKDLSVLLQNQNKNVLVLQTCYPPGTVWQRLLVVAEPVK